jgi:hypothetical protein
MSDEKRENEMTPFEAALAALMPRADRVDRERLMFAAGQQSVMAGRIRRNAAVLLWPGAFGLMSIVAATLLIMLLFKTGPGTSGNKVGHPVSGSSFAGNVNDRASAGKYADQRPGDRSMSGLAFLPRDDLYKSNGADSKYSYTQLLSQIIDRGVDTWEPNSIEPHNRKTTVSRPLTSRELMNQLLEQIRTGPS